MIEGSLELKKGFFMVCVLEIPIICAMPGVGAPTPARSTSAESYLKFVGDGKKNLARKRLVCVWFPNSMSDYVIKISEQALRAAGSTPNPSNPCPVPRGKSRCEEIHCPAHLTLTYIHSS